jgi:hypothetical protein
MPTAGYATVALTLPMSMHPHSVLRPLTATRITPAVSVSYAVMILLTAQGYVLRRHELFVAVA